MRVVVWNMKGASVKSPAWDYLRDLKPDLGLLQEVGSFPEDIQSTFQHTLKPAATKNGGRQKFGTAIIVRGTIANQITLSSQWPWVNKQLNLFDGNLVSAKVFVRGKPAFNIISVYSPPWPIEMKHFAEVDDKEFCFVKGEHRESPSVTELLWAALHRRKINKGLPWVIGGDFNLTEAFDYKWPGGPHGCKEFFERIEHIGFKECLRHINKKETPTFKHARGKIEHQLDHLFISPGLVKYLASCSTGDARMVFDKKLSDHLPIVADFED